MTPDEKAYVKALEIVAKTAQLMLDRLVAMEGSGVLSPVAKEAVADWHNRVAKAIKAVPPKPADQES